MGAKQTQANVGEIKDIMKNLVQNMVEQQQRTMGSEASSVFSSPQVHTSPERKETSPIPIPLILPKTQMIKSGHKQRTSSIPLELDYQNPPEFLSTEEKLKPLSLPDFFQNVPTEHKADVEDMYDFLIKHTNFNHTDDGILIYNGRVVPHAKITDLIINMVMDTKSFYNNPFIDGIN